MTVLWWNVWSLIYSCDVLSWLASSHWESEEINDWSVQSYISAQALLRVYRRYKIWRIQILANSARTHFSSCDFIFQTGNDQSGNTKTLVWFSENPILKFSLQFWNWVGSKKKWKIFHRCYRPICHQLCFLNVYIRAQNHLTSINQYLDLASAV